MRRIITAALAGVVAISMLCGCGKKNDTANNTVSEKRVEGVTLRLTPAEDGIELDKLSSEELGQLAQSLIGRLSSADFVDVIPEFENDNTIVINGVDDSEETKRMLTAKGVLTVTDTDGNTVMDGSALSGAWYRAADEPNKYLVRLTFTNDGAAEFAEISEAVSKKPEDKQSLSFALDAEQFANVKITDKITSDTVDLDGDFTSQSVKTIAVILNGGELPIELKIKD